jgi:hypothetical protein
MRMLLHFLACVPSATIALVGVQVDDLRADGTPWDGPALPPSAYAAALAGPLLEVDPAVPSALRVADGLARIAAAPDLRAEATLYAGGAAAGRLTLPAVSDAFVPSWCASLGPSCPTLGPVRMSKDVRLVVTLTDDDLAQDDPVAPVTLDVRTLRAVLRSGQLAVATDAQAQGEVRYVYVSVERAP